MSTSRQPSSTPGAAAAATGDFAIEALGVSKRFKLYHSLASGPLKELLLFWKRAQYYREFLAVDDVTLRVRRGEVVGIIGANGAGKTTLLKMIAGLLPVEKGSIRVNGKVTALLALGVGVHPDFTGRENIYYGGLLLGMSKREIVAKTPAIIEFAELGEFIDRPFRTYSSGMRARLLFSISMSIDPDILIVDEALATGDAHFVQKCTQRIRELCRSGATVLFVSHNLSQVLMLCDRACFMAEGRVVAQGSPPEVIAAYSQWTFARETGRNESHAPPRASWMGGSGRIAIAAARLRNGRGEDARGFHTGGALVLELDYTSTLPDGKRVGVFIGIIRESDNQWVGEISTNWLLDSLDGEVRKTAIEIQPAGTIRATLSPLLLLNNHYHLWVMLFDPEERYCEYRGLTPFFVARRDHALDRGPAFLQPCRIERVDRSDSRA
jgi:ABC-type polysaccharide/polyol phosphate transport system ATPase subunit